LTYLIDTNVWSELRNRNRTDINDFEPMGVALLNPWLAIAT